MAVYGCHKGLEKLIVVSVRHADVLLIATALLVIGIGLVLVGLSAYALAHRRHEAAEPVSAGAGRPEGKSDDRD